MPGAIRRTAWHRLSSCPKPLYTIVSNISEAPGSALGRSAGSTSRVAMMKVYVAYVSELGRFAGSTSRAAMMKVDVAYCVCGSCVPPIALHRLLTSLCIVSVDMKT